MNLNLDNGLILLRIKVRIHLLALVALADDHGLIQRGERSNFVYRPNELLLVEWHIGHGNVVVYNVDQNPRLRTYIYRRE